MNTKITVAQFVIASSFCKKKINRGMLQNVSEKFENNESLRSFKTDLKVFIKAGMCLIEFY